MTRLIKCGRWRSTPQPNHSLRGSHDTLNDMTEEAIP